MLKDWLVRRRENPYPSREEKKSLAQKTGLTYIQVSQKRYIVCLGITFKAEKIIFLFNFQICNWFANWRRKLKNAGKEPQKNTWGNLIKNYNNNARGNVEQFSISSTDSIWEDEERRNEYLESKLGACRKGEPPSVYFNSLLRFDQSEYVNPTYANPDGELDKTNTKTNVDGKCDDKNFSDEQCYQVNHFVCIKHIIY